MAIAKATVTVLLKHKIAQDKLIHLLKSLDKPLYLHPSLIKASGNVIGHYVAIHVQVYYRSSH